MCYMLLLNFAAEAKNVQQDPKRAILSLHRAFRFGLSENLQFLFKSASNKIAPTNLSLKRNRVRGRSRTFAERSRTFADVRGRSRMFADVRGRSRTFADVRGERSRMFADVRGKRPIHGKHRFQSLREWIRPNSCLNFTR